MGAHAREPDATASIELVRDAQAGDRAALERLFRRYYERVRRIVRLRLGARLRDRVDSEDILQETFASAVGSFANFEVRDEASLIHWFAKIAEHRIAAAAHGRQAVKRDPSREVALESLRAPTASGSIEFDLPAAHAHPLEEVVHTEELELVETAMEELREEQREVILLRNYAGASWETIAELMQRKSPDAVRMLYKRALIELAVGVRGLSRTRRRP